MLWEIRPLNEALKVPDVWDFFMWLDQMALRWLQGHYRYGSPKRSKKYMTRMELELDAYKKSGNKEHLVNVANYAYLESKVPENPKSHWDAKVESVTRGKV